MKASFVSKKQPSQYSTDEALMHVSHRKTKRKKKKENRNLNNEE